MKTPKDQFSTQSKFYKKFRPTYPPELYDFILSQVSDFNNCWDCGTGNGQVAGVLAEHFKNVYASDLSENQIQQAVEKENIQYSVQRAELTNYPDQFFDLITVGQALHWFDFDAFNQEVRRVLRPNGILAVWGYGLFSVNREIDAKVDHFYRNVVGPYWAFERSHVDAGYKTISLEIDDVEIDQEFSIELDWSIEHLDGFLNSWSAVQNYIKANDGKNPVPDCIDSLRHIWKGKVDVSIPLFLRLGRINEPENIKL